jgi:soluble lytic murein transglycosylase-like protein
LTWKTWNRAALVAGISLFSLNFSQSVQAEGGEGSSVIIEHDRQAVAHPPEEAQPAEASGQQAEAAEEIKPTETRKKSAARVEGTVDGGAAAKPGKAAAKTTKAEPQPASSATVEDEGSVETAKVGADEDQAEAKSVKRAAGSDAARATGLKVLIERYATENNIPYSLADAVIRIESRYQAGARNGPHMGLTQIHSATARSLGYAGEASGLLDAETNLRYGLKYLATAYKLAGGDTCGTILRYQAGHRAQTMTAAARKYCARVKIITAGAQ